MQGTKTPNGYLSASLSDGAAEAEVAIPDGTSLIEVTSAVVDVIVGLSNSDADMGLATDPHLLDTSLVKAAQAGPVSFYVNPGQYFTSPTTEHAVSAARAKRFTYVHYKPIAGAAGSIIVNFYK